jgi:hypothetical protein
MDISKQLDSIVAGLVEDIQQRVSGQITNTVIAELKRQLENYDFNTVISKLASDKLNEKIAGLEIDTDLIQTRVQTASNALIDDIEKKSKQIIDSTIAENVSKVNFSEQMSARMGTILNNKIKEIHFPDDSIPVKSIKVADLAITGDQVSGGIIKNFGSTGIDDKSTSCVVTIMDSAVVVENNLVTMDLTVEGNLEVKGRVSETSEFYKQLTTAVTGSVQAGLDTELFSGFSDTIFNKIATEGLDLNRITVNKNEVIAGNRIGYSITESNLQKLGLLKELQVAGESQFAETLYVGNKRAGINTIEPSAALAVWDEDIEITVSKDRDGQGRIGTPRNQSLVLGSNRNNNMVLGTDGSVQIDDLRVGPMRFGSSDKPPSFASTKGHVVFNSNPNVGGPLGWVCLGAANWANFGIID